MLHFNPYIADTCSLINLCAEGHLRLLTVQAAGGRLKAPARVVEELTGPESQGKGDPRLRDWLLRSRRQLEIPDEQVPEDVLAHVIRTYPKLLKGHRGLKAADPQFVAALKALRLADPSWVGISDDRAVREACEAEGLACLTSAEFIRREANLGS